jgi:hypothetical protein
MRRRSNPKDLDNILASAAKAGLKVERFEVTDTTNLDATERRIVVFTGAPEQDQGRHETSDELRKLL